MWKQTLYDGARMYYENKDYLANLLKHTTGHDSFMRYMAQINCSALEKYILSVNGNRQLTHEEMMCVKIPLYACAKEVVRQYREPLEKLGLTYTQ